MITTHVLDNARGVPAVGIAVVLELLRGDIWDRIGSGATDSRGRLQSLTGGAPVEPGIYRLTFAAAAYQRERGAASFYPEVQITFVLQQADEDVHVPLILSPFGYSTYRGT
jgi:5-hydroxyisourate hydrolase